VQDERAVVPPWLDLLLVLLHAQLRSQVLQWLEAPEIVQTYSDL